MDSSPDTSEPSVVATASPTVPLSSLTLSDRERRQNSHQSPGPRSQTSEATTPTSSKAVPRSLPQQQQQQPQCPPSPSAPSSVSADWPNTPTLTTAPDISAPNTPVHQHAVASATVAAAVAAAAARGAPLPGSGGQGPQSQPTEQLKRNWLNAWINNQPNHETQDPYGFVSTDPSRSNSPRPSQTGSLTQNDSYSQYGGDQSVSGTGSSTGGGYPTQTVHVPESLAVPDDPTTPTPASIRYRNLRPDGAAQPE